MKQMNKPGKNGPGYLRRYRRVNILWLLFWILVGVGIFVAGYLIWHTRANIFTVMAVLLVLPGAKRIVALIAAGKKRSVSDKRCQEVETVVEGGIYAYEYEPLEQEEDEAEGEAEEDSGEGSQEKDKKEAESTANEEPSAEQEESSEDGEPGPDESEGESEEGEQKNVFRPKVEEEPEICPPVVYTDYIFTSTEKIMMLDFMVVIGNAVIILPESHSKDIPYIEKYLTTGIRENSYRFSPVFVKNDEQLIRKIKELQKSKDEQKVYVRDRDMLLRYLMSLSL